VRIAAGNMGFEIWQRVDQELARRNKPWRWLAKQIGETEQTVNNWKRRGVPYKRHDAIADALGWSVDYLIGRIAGPDDAIPALTLESAVQLLCELFSRADTATRAGSSALLARIATNPDEFPKIAHLLRAMTIHMEQK
jgi:hypothetical protein